ncbi:hypothetical protein HKD37_05G014038 [Glycine soja]
MVPTAAAKELGSLAFGVEKGYPRRPVKLLDLSEPALIHREEGDDASLYGLRVNQRTSVAVAGVQLGDRPSPLPSLFPNHWINLISLFISIGKVKILPTTTNLNPWDRVIETCDPPKGKNECKQGKKTISSPQPGANIVVGPGKVAAKLADIIW